MCLLSYVVPQKTKKEKLLLIHKNHSLLKIQNKSSMMAPIRAETIDYLKLQVFINLGP